MSIIESKSVTTTEASPHKDDAREMEIVTQSQLAEAIITQIENTIIPQIQTLTPTHPLRLSWLDKVYIVRPDEPEKLRALLMLFADYCIELDGDQLDHEAVKGGVRIFFREAPVDLPDLIVQPLVAIDQLHDLKERADLLQAQVDAIPKRPAPEKILAFATQLPVDSHVFVPTGDDETARMPVQTYIESLMATFSESSPFEITYYVANKEILIFANGSFFRHRVQTSEDAALEQFEEDVQIIIDNPIPLASEFLSSHIDTLYAQTSTKIIEQKKVVMIPEIQAAQIAVYQATSTDTRNLAIATHTKLLEKQGKLSLTYAERIEAYSTIAESLITQLQETCTDDDITDEEVCAFFESETLSKLDENQTRACANSLRDHCEVIRKLTVDIVRTRCTEIFEAEATRIIASPLMPTEATAFDILIPDELRSIQKSGGIFTRKTTQENTPLLHVVEEFFPEAAKVFVTAEEGFTSIAEHKRRQNVVEHYGDFLEWLQTVKETKDRITRAYAEAYAAVTQGKFYFSPDDQLFLEKYDAVAGAQEPNSEGSHRVVSLLSRVLVTNNKLSPSGRLKVNSFVKRMGGMKEKETIPSFTRLIVWAQKRPHHIDLEYANSLAAEVVAQDPKIIFLIPNLVGGFLGKEGMNTIEILEKKKIEVVEEYTLKQHERIQKITNTLEAKFMELLEKERPQGDYAGKVREILNMRFIQVVGEILLGRYEQADNSVAKLFDITQEIWSEKFAEDLLDLGWKH